jgi:hypothetical protein
MLARTFEYLGIDPSFVPDALKGEGRYARAEEAVELSPSRRAELADLYRDDAERLAALVPDLDLDLWTNLRRS